MAKIDPPTQLVLLGARCALGWYAYKASPKLAAGSAAVGAVAGTFFLEVEDNPKVGSHISIDTLTMHKQNQTLLALAAVAILINHNCDHHALDAIPYRPAFGGYVVGCYSSYLWSGSKENS